MKVEYQQYLEEFEKWLAVSGSKDEKARRHIDNVDFFLGSYLPQTSARDIDEACQFISDFLGYFFIEECAWSTPATIEENVTSFKEFYKCMLENGHVSEKTYTLLLDTIREEMDDWVTDCEEHNNSSFDDLEDLLESGLRRSNLFEAAYEVAARSLGLDGLLGLEPDDMDEEDLPTKEETIRELTLVLLYLTSWREELLKGSGIKVRRSWKSADWDALDWMRDEGFAEGSNQAKSVYLTDEGVRRAEETLMLMGLGHLVTDDKK